MPQYQEQHPDEVRKAYEGNDQHKMDERGPFVIEHGPLAQVDAPGIVCAQEEDDENVYPRIVQECRQVDEGDPAVVKCVRKGEQE